MPRLKFEGLAQHGGERTIAAVDAVMSRPRFSRRRIEEPSPTGLCDPALMRPFFIAAGVGIAMLAVWAAARRRRDEDLGTVSSTWISEHVAHQVTP